MSEPQEQHSAATIAANHIRELIVSGQLSPGVQLRQDAVALDLKMSRVPVREALSSLSIEGLLEHIPNRGYFVRKYSVEQLDELYWVRDQLEPKLISSITDFDPDAVDAIAESHQLLSRAVDLSDIPSIVRLNREFHLRIMGMSRMSIILNLARQTWTMQSGYTAIYLASKTDHGAMVTEHAAMVDALRGGDAVKLTEICNLHRHAGVHRLHRILGAPLTDGSAPAANRSARG